MSVRRTELPHAAWTPLRNCWLRDKRISYKAKGLLGFLLSHNVGYDVTQAQMIRDSDDGRAAVVSGLAELESAGYLSRTRAQRDGGRFAEYDYDLADPFDADGKLIDTSAGNQRTTQGNSAENPTSDENRHGAGSPTSVDYPQRGIDPLEHHQGEQQELLLPAPALRAVAGPEAKPPTINQRANVLAREHYDACGGMASVPAVAGIVRRALAVKCDDSDKPRYTDDQVRTAIGELRDTGRPITLQTMRAALEAPGAVTRNGYRPNQVGPYRDPAPADYQTGF